MEKKSACGADTEQNKRLAGVQNSQNIFHMPYSVTSVTGGDLKGQFINHDNDFAGWLRHWRLWGVAEDGGWVERAGSQLWSGRVTALASEHKKAF